VQKSDREIMEILEAFDLTRCPHSAADLAGCDPKTVARYVGARDDGADPSTRLAPPILRTERNARCGARDRGDDGVVSLVAVLPAGARSPADRRAAHRGMSARAARRSEPDVEPDVGRGPRRADPHAAPERVPEGIGERSHAVEAAQQLPQQDQLGLRQRFVRDDVEPQVPPLERRLHGLRGQSGTSIGSDAVDGSTARATPPGGCRVITSQPMAPTLPAPSRKGSLS
jgi:hypothetical protein